MKFKENDIVRLKSSRTGREFIILNFEGCCARLFSKDPKDRRRLIEHIDNLILVRRGNV